MGCRRGRARGWGGLFDQRDQAVGGRHHQPPIGGGDPVRGAEEQCGARRQRQAGAADHSARSSQPDLAQQPAQPERAGQAPQNDRATPRMHRRDGAADQLREVGAASLTVVAHEVVGHTFRLR